MTPMQIECKHFACQEAKENIEEVRRITKGTITERDKEEPSKAKQQDHFALGNTLEKDHNERTTQIKAKLLKVTECKGTLYKWQMVF